MGKITRVHAREVLDSRGNPTIEVEVSSGKFTALAMVPSGASTGTHEAFELRDNDARRFFGKGVLNAVQNVNASIARKLRGMNPKNQKEIDELMIELDGTENKSNLGANAILGVSLACVKLAALEAGVPLFLYLNPKSRILPIPLINIINGGVHADSGLDFQEFMIIPRGAPTFREALRMGTEIFHMLKKILKDKGYATTVGDEGGFAPSLGSHEEALDYIVSACEKAKYTLGEQVVLGLDCASTEFFSNKKYHLKIHGEKKSVSSEELIAYYEALIKKYPLVSIEDGCAEDDWEGWTLLTEKFKRKLQLVGDDIFVTNPKRLERGIKNKTANAVLIKPNQIGTLTETMEVVAMAKAAHYGTVISHRSGETEDTVIADLAVALEIEQIKTGSLSRTDRIAKYNQLLRIEETLGRKGRYAEFPY